MCVCVCVCARVRVCSFLPSFLPAFSSVPAGRKVINPPERTNASFVKYICDEGEVESLLRPTFPNGSFPAPKTSLQPQTSFLPSFLLPLFFYLLSLLPCLLTFISSSLPPSFFLFSFLSPLLPSSPSYLHLFLASSFLLPPSTLSFLSLSLFTFLPPSLPPSSLSLLPYLPASISFSLLPTLSLSFLTFLLPSLPRIFPLPPSSLFYSLFLSPYSLPSCLHLLLIPSVSSRSGWFPVAHITA